MSHLMRRRRNEKGKRGEREKKGEGRVRVREGERRARKKKDGGVGEGGRVNDCTIYYVFKILIIF